MYHCLKFYRTKCTVCILCVIAFVDGLVRNLVDGIYKVTFKNIVFAMSLSMYE